MTTTGFARAASRLLSLTLSGARIVHAQKDHTMNYLLEQLAQPFEPRHITWKPGITKDNRCMALAYADLRAYMERLDQVCGIDWVVTYEPWGDNRIICRLTIQGVTRSSTGEMGTQDIKNEMGGTVAEAQAFKRAAAMFGLGRFLYDLPSVWVEFDPQRKRITEDGQKQLDARYLTWYNRKVGPNAKAAQPVSANGTAPEAVAQ